MSRFWPSCPKEQALMGPQSHTSFKKKFFKRPQIWMVRSLRGGPHVGVAPSATPDSDP